RAAVRLLPGGWHPQRADDGGGQLVPLERARAGLGPPAGVPRRARARAAEEAGAGAGAVARPEAARTRRRGAARAGGTGEGPQVPAVRRAGTPPSIQRVDVLGRCRSVRVVRGGAAAGQENGPGARLLLGI